jgi:formylglycine-generating enzyme required for sulfatase activity
MLSPNTILRDRYRIVLELGRGGMGAVYQAMDENLSCVVAVKETFATNEEQRRAFRREAQLLANLTHPTLPRVIDHFTHGEGQFLVMQFVPGHDLAELLQLRDHPFPVAKVLDWADQLLDALEDLHSVKPPIIHRDIKPSNLKVTPKGRILLLDFGLAKGAAGQMSTADAESHGKSIYGYTPNYAPIEQIRGAGTDPRSDLYSLAATLWTLLTGQAPADALSRLAEKEEGNLDPLRPAHEINRQVPPALSAALNRALSVNRNQRYPSAAEFREALSETRNADVEHPTRRKDRPETPAPVEPPIKSSDPAPPPLGSTIRPAEPEAPKPISNQQMPTLPVDSELRLPPPVIEHAGAPTSTSRFGDEGNRQPQSKRGALIVAGVLAVAVLVALVVWMNWPSTTNFSLANTANSSSSSGSTSPSNTEKNTVPVGMVHIPGGTFKMGRDGGDEAESPAHQVTVKPFYLDAYEVTNEDYEKFVKATGGKAPGTWTKGTYPSGAARKPVTGVTWDNATAYAKWIGKRLPSETEWEFAARGTDGRLYPWGNEWQPGSANANGATQSITDVGTYKGTSPFDAFDMVGNAWEWTASDFRPYPGGRIPSNQAGGNRKVIRGGSYESGAEVATATFRFGWLARGDRYDQTGFRCAKDVSQ